LGWQIIVVNSGGFVPVGTRAIISTTATLTTPLTPATDEGKIAVFDGISNTPTFVTPVDGDGILVNGETGVNENKGYVFDGTVPGGSWIQFTGLGLVDAGDGLTKTGNTIDVVGGDGITALADSIELDLKAGGGLLIDTGEVGVDASAIAGAGLEDDGTEKLRIAAAAAGDGLTGGGGSALAVVADGDTITVTASGVKGTKAQKADKELLPVVTSGDNFDTTLDIVATPVGDRYIQVFVNGLKVVIGDASKLKDCYFSVDAGANARALGDIVATDDFIWNGVIAGYQLETDDSIDFDYEIAA
jgi:hypothetical protein